MPYLKEKFQPEFTESLYKLKAPTCAKYEPNYGKIFQFVQDGYMNEEKNIFSPEGNIVASIWDGKQIFGFKKWLAGIDSNRAILPLLIKNPYRLPEQEGSIGIQNGLVCTARYCFCSQY